MHYQPWWGQSDEWNCPEITGSPVHICFSSGSLFFFSSNSIKAKFSFPKHLLCIMLFVSVVNGSGRALSFIVAVLHFFFFCSSPHHLLRGLCMNSHCHVQGRVAQGQLIAFMIMISRQIYCACSEHIFQLLPTLWALDGGGGFCEFTAPGCDFLFKCRSHFLSH